MRLSPMRIIPASDIENVYFPCLSTIYEFGLIQCLDVDQFFNIFLSELNRSELDVSEPKQRYRSQAKESNVHNFLVYSW